MIFYPTHLIKLDQPKFKNSLIVTPYIALWSTQYLSGCICDIQEGVDRATNDHWNAYCPVHCFGK